MSIARGIARSIARPITGGDGGGVVSPIGWFELRFDEGSGLLVQNKISGDITLADVAGTPEQKADYLTVTAGTHTNYAGDVERPNASRWTVVASGANFMRIPVDGITGTYKFRAWIKAVGTPQQLRLLIEDGGVHYSPELGITPPEAGLTWDELTWDVPITGSLVSLVLYNVDGNPVDIYLDQVTLEPGTTVSAYPEIDWALTFTEKEYGPAWVTEGMDFRATHGVGISANRPKELTAFTCYFAVKLADANAYAPVISSNSAVVPDLLLSASHANNQTLTFSVGTSGAVTNKLDIHDSDWHILAIQYSQASEEINLYLDGNYVLGAEGDFGSLTLDRYFLSDLNRTSGYDLGGYMAYASAFETAHTAAQVLTETHRIQDLIAPRGITAVDLPEIFILQGDSRAEPMVTTLSPDLKYVNLAVGGSTLVPFTYPYPPYNAYPSMFGIIEETKRYFRPGGRVIHYSFTGQNDFGLSDITAADLMVQMEAYWAELQAHADSIGCELKIISATLTPNADSSFNTKRNAFNTLIRASSTPDAVVDYGADTFFAKDEDGSNTGVYPDGVHWASGLYGWWQALLDDAVTSCRI